MMKSLMEHYGYGWMVRRPEPVMFGKQVVCISAASDAGMRCANKDMADWGHTGNKNGWDRDLCSWKK